MKVRNVVRRLGAVAATGAMVGATAMGALAADLSSYPSMFVTDGTFNGFLVVGENAASMDNLAMTDIAAGMKVSSGAGSVTTVSGDAWMVGTSSKKLEMSNTNTTPVGEQIYDIEQFISTGELAALASGTYSTSGSSSSYQQYLYFDIRNNAQNEIVVFAENEGDVVADFLQVKSGNNIGEYILEFSSSPESTIRDTAGSASTSGAVLDDFENTRLTMLGMEFDVVLARRPQSTPEDSVKLTLMGGAVRGSLLEGESTSMQLRDTTYDVTLTFVDETYVKFTVNGEQTDKLQKGDTHKLADGNEIGVSERLYQSYAGGVHSADFFLGASKVELRDNVISDSISDTALKVGTETISGADVVIEGTDDNTTFTLTKIRVNMTAQDDYFVPAGGKLSEAIVGQGDDKEMLFTNNWDMEYQGLTEEATHQVRIRSSTDRKYNLQWFDGDNNMVDLPLAYANSSTTLQLSEDATDKGVILNEALNISKNDYFVLTSGTAADGSMKSFALQYKGADKSTATSPKIKLKNLGSGDTLEYAIDTGASSAVATIKLGGNSFLVKNITTSAKTSSDFVINVDLNGDGTLADDVVASAEVDIMDKYGVLIDFGGRLYTGEDFTSGLVQPLANETGSLEMNWSFANANDYDNQAPPLFNIVLNATTTNEVTTTTFNIDGATHPSITPEGEENVGYGMTTLGAKWTYTTPSGSPQELTLDVPEEQRLPQVFITSGATASAKTGGNLVAVEGVVGASKLDSEVASVSAQNLIVVGGPCVNTVAAELLGNPADCTEGFRPGVSRVKLFTHANGNVAMLVAGFSGQDTRNAGGFLATRLAEMTGDEVELEGTTSSDLTVSAPRAVVAEVATVE